MRKLNAVVMLAVAALLTVPAHAADYPEYPPYNPPPLPPVDYGLGGSFYLRGSVGVNVLTARTAEYDCVCGSTTFDDLGYGYSLGVGLGYETGDGFRGDVTIDYLSNDSLRDTGGYTLALRSGLLLVNGYYDFSLENGGGLGAEGGLQAYVGAGIGAAYNSTTVTGSVATPDGKTVEAAGAIMVGVAYDMGNMVADLGYRGIYMNQITNGAATPFYINDAFIHELRGTVRYRFN